MSASGKTPNFDFPLYEVQDNFAPLTSFNLLSNKADQQLALVKSSADTAEALSSANEQDIQALETWKAGLMNQLSSVLNTRFLTINNTQQGTVQSLNAKLGIIGNLLYLYSNNKYTISDMIRIPIQNFADAYVIFSTPELPFSMNYNQLYEIGVHLTSMVKKDNVSYEHREMPYGLIRQQSITYVCVRMSDEDITLYNSVLTLCNSCMPFSAFPPINI